MFNYSIELKTVWQKENLPKCFHKSSTVEASKCVYMCERDKRSYVFLFIYLSLIHVQTKSNTNIYTVQNNSRQILYMAILTRIIGDFRYKHIVQS